MASLKVTVLMAVYNGEKYLKEAIDSMLAQTFRNFEFIIIDDGSDDETARIISSYRDERIQLVINKKNMGLAGSLNKGILLANGEYIARMDADDISLPKRLATQVEFLDSHQDIDIVGAWATVVGVGSGRSIKHPTYPDIIKANLLFHTSMVHPSVMMRRSLFAEFDLKYDPEFMRAQDYKLWAEASKKTRLANIDRFLILYRQQDKKVQPAHKEVQDNNADAVRRRQILDMGINPTNRELELHLSICHFRPEHDIRYLKEVEQWLLKLIAKNKEIRLYKEDSLASVIASEWYNICYVSSRNLKGVFKIFRQSPLCRTSDILKYLVKKIWVRNQ